MLEILGRWCGALEGMHFAIDGKTLRGTDDAELGRHTVHLLRDSPAKISLRRKRVRAAPAPDFRLQLLSAVHA
jgi:hypothetical protein